MRAPGVCFILLAMCLAGSPTAQVRAHGGGLNSEGWHYNRKQATIIAIGPARLARSNRLVDDWALAQAVPTPIAAQREQSGRLLSVAAIPVMARTSIGIT